MTTSPTSAQCLRDALSLHGWTQSELAERTGLDRATISHHLTCARPVRDDHLAAYCRALYSPERKRLVAAWLRDTLDAETVLDVLTDDSEHAVLRDEVASYRPSLPHDLRLMLDWVETQLGADPELADVMRIGIRRAGYRVASRQE
jgi:transcriptional regulator with XRE-family HTH domain